MASKSSDYFNSIAAKATITVSNDAISTNSLPVDISGRPNIIGFGWWQFARGKGIEDRVLGAFLQANIN